jgi:hypothetical protein
MSVPCSLWAEAIERASPAERARMGFGPYHVEPEGHLGLFLETIDRTPKPGADVPPRWPIGRAPGWQRLRIDEEWSLNVWCALGGEWILHPPDTSRTRSVFFSDCLPDNAETRIHERINNPLELLSSGDAFAFCGSLFILPDSPFVMNSFWFHPKGHEPLGVFVGFRGHTKPYAEVITPGVFRAMNNPTEENCKLYSTKARIARNVTKQIMYETENIILTQVQAGGILQHYGIIGPTDILDLSYDVNIAKWFALNVWDRDKRAYTPKLFREHSDGGKGHDECSIIYTVMVRVVGTQLDPTIVQDFLRRSNTSLMPWDLSSSSLVALLTHSLPRNVSPLWSQRPARQSGFGLRGIWPREDDAFGSVLGIVEHRFHPTFAPDGWNRIGGAQVLLDGTRYSWEDDMSRLAPTILPEDNKVIANIRATIQRLFQSLGLA